MSSEQRVASPVDQSPAVPSDPQEPKPMPNSDHDTVIDLRDGVTPSVHVSGAVVEPIVDDGVDSDSVHDEIERAEAEQTMLHAVKDAALAPTGIEMLAKLIRANTATDEDTPPQDDEATRLFAEQHFVKTPPHFSEIVSDASREMPFRYFLGEGRYATMTEHEGLSELGAFLDEFIATVANGASPAPGVELPNADKMLAQAQSMRENLTFIGWPEYQEAVAGIGSRWKEFLDSNPDSQICILAEIGGFQRYQRFDNRKSDDVMREDVLLTFSDEELERYGDRIVGSLDDINRDPDNVRIVMADDWTISGRQMRELYKNVILKHPVGKQVAEQLGVEINLITASGDRIEKGLLANPHKPQRGSIPVYAYYKSHDAPEAQYEGNAHVTGQHSAVNYDFYDTLIGMFKLHQRLGGPRRRILGLARIEPWYRTVPSVVTTKNGSLVKISPEEAMVSDGRSNG
jgi:hypothetical protein